MEYLGCNLSGERALLNKGDLGSAVMGLLKDFFVDPDTRLDPGLNDCGLEEEQLMWTGTPVELWHASGDGDLVGEEQINADGDGVLAKGDKGMFPIDFLPLGD